MILNEIYSEKIQRQSCFREFVFVVVVSAAGIVPIAFASFILFLIQLDLRVTIKNTTFTSTKCQYLRFGKI